MSCESKPDNPFTYFLAVAILLIGAWSMVEILDMFVYIITSTFGLELYKTQVFLILILGMAISFALTQLIVSCVSTSPPTHAIVYEMVEDRRRKEEEWTKEEVRELVEYNRQRKCFEKERMPDWIICYTRNWTTEEKKAVFALWKDSPEDLDTDDLKWLKRMMEGRERLRRFTK